MFIIDTLYGGFELPGYLAEIFKTPALQRLKDVRLLNIHSTSLAAAGDIRRLTHSLGVSFLGQRVKQNLHGSFPEEVLRAWHVALAVHDVGTPPFGHLFERALSLRSDWNHEKKLSDIILGRYRPENIHHQIYYGRELNLHSTFRSLGIDTNLVTNFVNGEGPLGPLVASSIDLDNIDNVYRVHAALGLGHIPRDIFDLVDAMVIIDGSMGFKVEALGLVEKWAEARRKCYQVMVFDEQVVAAQAMLFQAFEIALDPPDNILSAEYWHLTDDQILTKLSNFRPTKDIIHRYACGDYYNSLGMYWFEFDSAASKALRDANVRIDLEKFISKYSFNAQVILYPFEDKGTFSKSLKLDFIDTKGTIETIELSKQSTSLVIGVFTPSKSVNTSRLTHQAILSALSSIGLTSELRRSIPDIKDLYEFRSQSALPI